jgi:hypothetical protein
MGGAFPRAFVYCFLVEKLCETALPQGGSQARAGVIGPRHPLSVEPFRLDGYLTENGSL